MRYYALPALDLNLIDFLRRVQQLLVRVIFLPGISDRLRPIRYLEFRRGNHFEGTERTLQGHRVIELPDTPKETITSGVPVTRPELEVFNGPRSSRKQQLVIHAHFSRHVPNFQSLKHPSRMLERILTEGRQVVPSFVPRVSEEISRNISGNAGRSSDQVVTPICICGV